MIVIKAAQIKTSQTGLSSMYVAQHSLLRNKAILPSDLDSVKPFSHIQPRQVATQCRAEPKGQVQQAKAWDPDLENRWGLPCLIGATLISFSPFQAFADVAPQPTTEIPTAVENVVTQENETLRRQKQQKSSKTSKSDNKEASKKVKINISVEGESVGSVTIKPYNDAPIGTERFLALAQRRSGGYRLSKVDGTSDAFVTFTGILQINYVGMDKLPGGETVEELEAEQALANRSHDRAGLVSLIVKEANPSEVKEKTVAYNGKLIKVQEVKGKSNANGTGFAITLGPAPLLNDTNLIIGEVEEGMDVLKRISQIPRVKSASNSPFFKVAKVLGDRRADVAAKSFGKPLSRVVIDSVSVET